MPVIKTLKNGVWTKVSSFGELATATSSLNGLMSSADKNKLDSIGNAVNLIEVDVSFTNGTGIISNDLIKSNSHCLANIKTSAVTSIVLSVGTCTNGSVSLYAWNADASHSAFTGTKRVNCLVITPNN